MKRHISAPRAAKDQCKTAICSIFSAVLRSFSQSYGHSLKVIEDMAVPLVVETTVVEAVVEAEAVDNNNKRGQRRKESPDDSIKQQRILRPRF